MILYPRDPSLYSDGYFDSPNRNCDPGTEIRHKWPKCYQAITKKIGGATIMLRCGCKKQFRARLDDCNGERLFDSGWAATPLDAERALYALVASVAKAFLADEWEFGS